MIIWDDIDPDACGYQSTNIMTSEIPQGYFSEFVTNFPNFILVWHNTIGINFAILDIASDSGTVQLELEA